MAPEYILQRVDIPESAVYWMALVVPAGLTWVHLLGPRAATAQVVLRVALVDKSGAVLGDNPLAGVANLAPGEAREARFVVRCRPPPYAADARVAVSLVRWGP